MIKRKYKEGDSVVVKDNFTGRSKYRRFSGRKGRITYVFQTSNSYDIKLNGSETILNRVSPKMFRLADELATPGEKREALKKSLITRKKEAEATVKGKMIQIADLLNRLEYLDSDESITVINENEYIAWTVATRISDSILNQTAAESLGARVPSRQETLQKISSIVLESLNVNIKSK